MKVLIFGGGDLAQRFKKHLLFQTEYTDVRILDQRECDVVDYRAVVDWVEQEKPDYIVCTAGLSDRRVGVDIRDVVNANLIGPMNVGTVAAAFGTPCILVASTAGMSPGTHKWYGPAKAGVINFVRAMANDGAQIYAISPGRMHTRMRQEDFPFEDAATRLDPGYVAGMMIRILKGDYAPGANVVVRKVGLSRIDVYEEVPTCLPSLLSD